MLYRRIAVESVTPTIGVVASAAALAEANEATAAEIHDAWMERCVMFFSNQALTPEQNLAFGRCFGPLHAHPAAPYAHGDPALMVIHADAASKRNSGAGWQSDVSMDAEPTARHHLASTPNAALRQRHRVVGEHVRCP